MEKPLNFLAVSDRHNEIYRKRGLPIPDIEVESPIDCLVFAGDIDNGTEGVKWAISQCEKHGVPGFYVPGNHEYYDGNYMDVRQEIIQAAQYSPLVVLDNDTFFFKGVRIIGSTLWSDYKLLEKYGVTQESVFKKVKLNSVKSKKMLADFSHIDYDEEGDALTPKDVVNLHYEALDYIESVFLYDDETPTLLITHHSPSEKCLKPRREGVEYNIEESAYASHLESFMAQFESLRMLVHGHTHCKVDFRLENNARIYSNPMGHMGELPNYRDEVVTLPVNVDPSLKKVANYGM